VLACGAHALKDQQKRMAVGCLMKLLQIDHHVVHLPLEIWLAADYLPHDLAQSDDKTSG
jgi:hypothetical protein